MPSVRLLLKDLLTLLLVVGMLAGCNTAPPVNAVKSESTGQQVPFSKKPTGGQSNPALPNSITVPAGTPISVRLQESLSSETAHAGQAFRAVLDEPLMADGVAVVPRGAAITGRVLAVRRSGGLRAGGILQLALDSVDVGGEKILLQTSSVIANAAPRKVSPNSAYAQGGRVSVGAQRRLTFRLRQPTRVAGILEQRSSPPS